MILDSDDLFANENIFNICFNEAKQKDIDIIEFSGFKLNNEYFRLIKLYFYEIYNFRVFSYI